MDDEVYKSEVRDYFIDNQLYPFEQFFSPKELELIKVLMKHAWVRAQLDVHNENIKYLEALVKK